MVEIASWMASEVTATTSSDSFRTGKAIRMANAPAIWLRFQPFPLEALLVWLRLFRLMDQEYTFFLGFFFLPFLCAFWLPARGREYADPARRPRRRPRRVRHLVKALRHT